MRIIAFIEDKDTIKKILQHLGLWHVKRIPPPKAHAPPIDDLPVWDNYPSACADYYLIDPSCPVEYYIQ